MSLPCVEVADAPATEAYIANPKDVTIVKPALDILKNSKGIIKVYSGLQTEDAKHAFVYNVWEDIKDHHSLQAEPVIYPELGRQVGRFMTRASDVIHIQPTAEPYKALGAPATELAFMTVKPGQSKEAVEAKLVELVTAANSLPESWGAISAVWGPTVEKPDTLGLIIGWTSVDAHWKTVQTVPQLIQLLKEMREIADISLTHAELTEY